MVNIDRAEDTARPSLAWRDITHLLHRDKIVHNARCLVIGSRA